MRSAPRSSELGFLSAFPRAGSARMVVGALFVLVAGALAFACGSSAPKPDAITGAAPAATVLPTTATSIVGVGETVEEWQKSPAQRMGLTDLPADMPAGFWFSFRYSSDRTHYLEVRPRAGGSTYEGTYVQGGVGGTTLLTLSRDEVKGVYDRIRAVGLLRYPVVFGAPASPAATGEGYVLAVGYGDVEHSVSWFDDGGSQLPEAVALRGLFRFIEDLAHKVTE